VESQQLPTESQVFEDEIPAGTESDNQPAEEIPERHDHGKNLIGTVELRVSQGTHLRAYDVLARYRPFLLPPSLNCCLNRGLLRREVSGE
jgi:hypothetical protein